MPPAAATAPGYGATVAALALGQLLTWAALFYGFSSFVLPMQRELHWDLSVLMGANTLGLAVYGAASYGIGAAIDRGRGRLVMTGGALLGGLGCVAWSRVDAVWMLYAVWVLLGLAMAATLYEPAFAVLTKRYPERYRHGITALTLVGGFASTLSFPAAALLIDMLGWRPALLLIGALLIGVAPLHAWALRGTGVVSLDAGRDAAADATMHQALRMPTFWLLTAAFTLYALAPSGLWAHAWPAFADKGVAQADALAVLACIGPSQVAGRLVFAWIGRAWSLRLLGTIVLALMPVAMALFALGDGFAAMLLFALLFGIANGLVTIVRGGIVPLYFGRAHIGRIGGLMAAVGFLARAGAPLLVAALLAWLPGYRELLLLLALIGAVAVVAFWLAGPPATDRLKPAN